MSGGEVIDYDRLYAEYLASLVDTLRGFAPGVPGLDLWVPHDDPLTSLRNLLDAAVGGRGEIALRFGPGSRAQLDGRAVQALAARYGHARVLATEDELLVAITGLARPAPDDGGADRPVPRTPSAPLERPTATLAPPAASAPRERVDAYAAALASAPPPNPGADAGDLIWVAADTGVGQLQLGIEPGSHGIAAARFTPDRLARTADPATGEAHVARTRAMFAHLCPALIGLPVLEAAHHGAIRLEANLRDAGARPVAGVILPGAADAGFAVVASALRACLAAYRAATGYAETTNTFAPGPGPRWMAASRAQREALVSAAVRPLLAARAGDAVALVAIEHDVRLVFALPEELPDRAGLLLALEDAIQTQVDPRLEVYAEERKDRNKLRRLAVVKEAER